MDEDRAVAACVGKPTRLFYPPSEEPAFLEQILLAKSICRDCELRQACLDDAIVRAEPYGIWGGRTVRERRILRRRLVRLRGSA